MTDSGSPVVLVVEDDPDVAETYRMWLGDDYDVRIEHSGQAALEAVSEAVDVVLLDRMMPEMSGDQVLAELRDRDLDARVAMVTAVDPDFDIVEMGFDEYVAKPPTREGLRGTVEDLLEREAHADRLQQYQGLVATRAALEAEKSDAELQDSDQFQRLEERIEALEDDLDEEAEELTDDAQFISTLRAADGAADEDPFEGADGDPFAGDAGDPFAIGDDEEGDR